MQSYRAMQQQICVLIAGTICSGISSIQHKQQLASLLKHSLLVLLNMFPPLISLSWFKIISNETFQAATKNAIEGSYTLLIHSGRKLFILLISWIIQGNNNISISIYMYTAESGSKAHFALSIIHKYGFIKI